MLLSGLAQFGSVHAVEIESVIASKAGVRYTVELMLVADIPETFAREILENPDRVVQVNNELIAVYHIPGDQPGVRWFRDHTRACVLFFCVDYKNTLSLRILENRDIQLIVEPELSEFKYGVFTWRTEPVDKGRTRLIFNSVSEPGFWVPTIGLLKYRMRKGIREMVLNMECEYRQDEKCVDPDWEDLTLSGE